MKHNFPNRPYEIGINGRSAWENDIHWKRKEILKRRFEFYTIAKFVMAKQKHKEGTGA